MTYAQWKSQAVGRPIDVDNAFGDQCVDVLLDYAQSMFPGHGWPELLGYGNAKDLFNSANSSYFEKILNDHNDPNQLPQQGDLMIYDATPTNPYGHCGICDGADGGGVNLIQQDGSVGVDQWGNAHNNCREVYRPWSRSSCIGWLRPKISASPTPAPAQPAGFQRQIGADGVNYRQAPNTSAGIIQEFPADDVLDFKGFVRGESYAGNDIWFVGKYTGGYCWSGAFKDVGTHDLPDLTPSPTPPPSPVPTPNPDPQYSPRPDSGLFLIDVSQHQDDIDWPKLGGVIDGAILHVGHVGASFGGNENCTDNHLAQNQIGSRGLGIETEYYYYIYFSEDPELEAHRFMVGIGNLLTHESLFVDVEEVSGANEDWLWKFVNAVEAQAGRRCHIYTYYDYAQKHDWLKNFIKDGRKVWLAHYGVAAGADISGTPVGKPIMHQYADNGKLPGISTRVDLNRFDGTVAELRALATPFEIIIPTPIPDPIPSPEPVPDTPPPTPKQDLLLWIVSIYKLIAKWLGSWRR